MRSLRLVFAIMAAIVGLVLFASPASAGVSASEWITIQNGPDVAEYDSYYNILTVCDESGENGTARAILDVVNGNTKELYDTNGAAGGCAHVGPLNVDNSKRAHLSICTNSNDSTCFRTVYTFPV